MEQQGGVAGPQVAGAAKRFGLGRPVAPPPALAFYLLAKEFGIAPWQVAEASLADFATAWGIYTALQEAEAQQQRMARSKKR